MFPLGAKDTCVYGSGISNMLKLVTSGIGTTDWSQNIQNSSAYNRDQIAFRFDNSFDGGNTQGCIANYKAELARLYAAGTPLEVVYELATPLTYHFDNVGQLTTLLGTNNIWATTGDVTVEYYYQLGRIYPTTGTFNDEECYAYKQDGLTYDNYDTSALARVAVHPVGEDDVAYYYPTGVTSGNTLDITNNALLYGASAADMSGIAQTVYDGVTGVGQYRPMDVNMFPNECPFKSGQIVPVTDAQGVSFTTALMSSSPSSNGSNVRLVRSENVTLFPYSVEMSPVSRSVT